MIIMPRVFVDVVLLQTKAQKVFVFEKVQKSYCFPKEYAHLSCNGTINITSNTVLGLKCILLDE